MAEKPVNYTALATAAATLRDEITFANESAKLVVAAYMEAEDATPLTMCDVLDRLMESKPHLFWPSKPETQAGPSSVPDSRYTGMTADMLRKRQAQAVKAEAPAVNPFMAGTTSAKHWDAAQKQKRTV